MSYADQLGLSEEEFDAVENVFQRCTHEHQDYRVLPNARHGIERGTVLFDGIVVRGYPSTPRTLVLEAGIRRFFDGEFTVEEKLNGYNTRITRIGDVLAFTRSGYVCPFTTHTITRSLSLERFFDDHPSLVLVGETIGPENPYTTHDYSEVESIAFYVFDIRERTTGDPLSVSRRHRLCTAYDLPQVDTFGTFDPTATDAVSDIVADLDDRGREGIVMKSFDGTQQLKYSTHSANDADLGYAFALPFDYGRDFVFSRVVREAFQAVERDERDVETLERAHELGEAILLPMVEAIRNAREGPIGERHTIRGDSTAIEETLEQLRRRGLDIDVVEERTDDGERVVTFVKRSSSSTDKIRYYLSGGTVDE